MMRRGVGIIVGVLLAFMAIALVEFVVGRLFGLSLTEIESADRAALARFVEAMPLAAKLIVALGWFLGSWTGATAALRLAQWRPAGWIVAALVAAGGVWNAVVLPQPWWMNAAALLAPLAGGWLAERRFRRARPGDPLIG